MIPEDALPGNGTGWPCSTPRATCSWPTAMPEIGIDHFARPGDGLAVAAKASRLRRNFQGYTDDGAEVLLGLGASSISRFPQGYAQNAPATGAYRCCR